MKRILLPALLAAAILMPCVTQAGTLENRDLNDYRYETFDGRGVPLFIGIILSRAKEYNFCYAGCELRLLNTGQTIIMTPYDYVVINDGVMKYEED